MQGPCDPQQEERDAGDLKPGMAPSTAKTRDDKARDDLARAPLGAHDDPGDGRIGQFLHSVFLFDSEEDGLVGVRTARRRNSR